MIEEYAQSRKLLSPPEDAVKASTNRLNKDGTPKKKTGRKPTEYSKWKNHSRFELSEALEGKEQFLSELVKIQIEYGRNLQDVREKQKPVRKRMILQALKQTGGLVTPACGMAGIHSDTLYTWIKESTEFKAEVEDAVEKSEAGLVLLAQNHLKLEIENGGKQAAVCAMYIMNRKGGKASYQRQLRFSDDFPEMTPERQIKYLDKMYSEKRVKLEEYMELLNAIKIKVEITAQSDLAKKVDIMWQSQQKNSENGMTIVEWDNEGRVINMFEGEKK